MKIRLFLKLAQYGFKLLLAISVTLSTSIWQSHIHSKHLDSNHESAFTKAGGARDFVVKQVNANRAYSLSDHRESLVDSCNKTDLSEPEENDDVFHALAPVKNSTKDAGFQAYSRGSRIVIHPNQVLKVYLHKQSFLC